jgi:hypothetical protein
MYTALLRWLRMPMVVFIKPNDVMIFFHDRDMEMMTVALAEMEWKSIPQHNHLR